MKKALAIGLAAVMAVSMCAPVFASDDSESGAGIAKEDLKIGAIYIGDENEGYTAAHMAGIDEMVENLGLDDSQVIEKTLIGEDEGCYDAAADLADQGCQIIFANSFGHETYILEAAGEYPDIQFCHATGTQAASSGLSNMHNYFTNIYEARYVSGVVAGLKLNQMIEDGTVKEDACKIGYVGAFPYAEVISGYTSYFLGARSVCPTATMEVTFTGSWYDETAEKEGANKLIANGCKLISQHADSMGAPTACETAGVPNVSYNGSTVAACPNTFIVSSRINWAPYYEYVVNCVRSGEAIAADWTGTIATGSVVLTDINEQAAAAGTADKVAEVKADIESGKIHVFDTTTFTVEGKALDSYLADVDTDPAYTPDTEVVENGFFNESAKRSAPYFDLKIDGITLLDTAF